MAEIKNKGGRPTKYNSSMCDAVIEMGKQGMSKAEMSLELDICYETFNNWQNENKEFLHAVKKAERLSEGWWTKKGRVNLENGKFNYTGWYMNMKNRFKWSDKQEVSGPDGKNLTVQLVDYGDKKD